MVSGRQRRDDRPPPTTTTDESVLTAAIDSAPFLGSEVAIAAVAEPGAGWWKMEVGRVDVWSSDWRERGRAWAQLESDGKRA